MLKTALLITALLITCRVHGQLREVGYINPADTTTNYYIAYRPIGAVKGLLLLLTSFGETPQHAAKETNIHKIAVSRGLIAVYASLQQGTETFFVDSTSQLAIEKMAVYLQEKYKLTNKPFYLGGFSLGGSGVIKYAERAYQSTGLVKPKAIFAIDPPLDFKRMYLSLKQEVRQSKSDLAKNEASYFIKRIDYECQNTTHINSTPFQTISPYLYSDTLQTNIRYLIKCPIRLITEPDLIWQMQERNRSIYSLNAIDCSSAINSLRLLGNKNASLVVTSGKGYRKLTGKRNPHSWSIANSWQIINWLLQF